MKTLISSLLCAIACLTIVSGTRAQSSYQWSITHPSSEGVFSYAFTALDSWGEVVTAAGVRKDDTLRTNDRNAIIFCRSTDGGETWTEQDPGLAHFKADGLHLISKIQQIDSLNCVGLGDSGRIVRTTDGGNTWVTEYLPTTGTVFDMDFSDPMTGIVVCLDTSDIFTTTDGGNHWNLAPFHPWYPATQCHSYGNEHFLISIVEGFTVYETKDNWILWILCPPSLRGPTKLILFQMVFGVLEVLTQL